MSASKKKSFPRRCLKVLAVANPRRRTSSDSHDSNMMSDEDMRIAAKNYAGKPIKFYHDEHGAYDLGTMTEAFVSGDRLCTYFDINRDPSKPLEWCIGSDILSGVINGVSASTQALRDRTTGQVMSNCASPETLKAIGAPSPDPCIELSVCTRKDAARGEQCEILRVEEWEEQEEGQYSFLGSPYKASESRMTKVLSSDAEIYKNCMDEAFGPATSKPIDHFEPFLVQACLSAASKKTPTFSSSATAVAMSESTPSSSSSSTPTPPTSSGTSTPAAAAAAIPEKNNIETPSSTPVDPARTVNNKRKESFDNDDQGGGNAEDDGGDAVSKRARNPSDSKANTDDDLMDMMRAIQADLKSQKEINRRLMEAENRRVEEQKRTKLEASRAEVNKLVEKVIEDYQQQLVDAGEKPEEDRHYKMLKSVCRAETEDDLSIIKDAALFAQKCTFGNREMKKKLHAAEAARKQAESKQEQRRDALIKASALARRNQGDVASMDSQSSREGVAARTGSNLPWMSESRMDALINGSSSSSSSRAAVVPPVQDSPSSSSTGSAAPMDSTDSKQGNAEQDAATIKFQQFFEEVDGAYVPKGLMNIAPQFSTDRVIPREKWMPTLNLATPSAAISPDYNGAIGVPFGEKGMQWHHPDRFHAILQQCCSSAPSGYIDRYMPGELNKSMLAHKPNPKASGWDALPIYPTGVSEYRTTTYSS